MLIQAALVAIVMLFGLAFLGLGVAMAVLALGTIASDAKGLVLSWRSKHWPTTTGTIVRSVVRKGIGSRRLPSYSTAITYAYEVAGRSCSSTRFQLCSWWGSNTATLDVARHQVARFPKGASVTVFFDPAHPERATLDRQPPTLGLSVFFGVLLLPLAALVIPVAVDMTLGPLRSPPEFAPGELPPLGHQVGGLLLLLGAVSLLVAWRLARRGRADRDLVMRLATASPTRIADVKKGQYVAVFGRVEAGAAGTVPAPVTNEPVVYHRALVRLGGQTLLEVTDGREFHVRDDSGRLAVPGKGSSDQFVASTPRVEAGWRDWVDDQFATTSVLAPEHCAVAYAGLSPGDPVLVVGRVFRDPERREFRMQPERDDPLALVIAREPLPQLIGRLTRSATRGRRIANWAIAALLVGCALLAS